MLITVLEWAAFFVYILIFIAALAAEVKWLTRKGWATSGRAVGYVMTSDLLGVGVGGTIALTIFFLMFMMVMGPAGRGSDAPEAAYAVGMILMVILPPAILFATKRLFLLIFKMRSGKQAWIYSLVSSIVIFVVIILPPPIMYYILDFLDKWK